MGLVIVINLKLVKSLKTKKGRDEHGLFIIEGAKLVAEIPPNWRVCAYICAESYSHKPSEAIIVSDSRFASLSDTVTPQGIMAVCEKQEFKLADIASDNPFILRGETLSDPGNIGTLIRTAAAAGADGVILSNGSGDIYNPKTIRAAAGASLRIPIIEKADLNAIIPILQKRKINVLAAHINGEVSPYGINLKQGCAIVVGNEAHGLSEEVSALADVRVKLPMARDVESLNASVAGGILIYEVLRQRVQI